MREIELELINKIIEDNSIFYNLHINYKAFKDIINKSLFKFIGSNIVKNGGFKMIEIDQKIYKKLNTKGHMDELELKSAEDLRRYIGKYEPSQSYRYYEGKLKERYDREQLKKTADSILTEARDTDININQIIRKSAFEIDKLMYSANEEIEVASGADMIESEKEYQESDQKIENVPSNINLIDDFSGGFKKPSFNCVAATAKTGKSTILTQSAILNAMNGYNVLYASVEMSNEKLRRRMFSFFTGYEFKKIYNKQWKNKAEYEDYIEKLDGFKEFQDNIHLLHKKSGMSCQLIESQIDSLSKAGIDIDIIYIDHMNLLKSNNPKLSAKVEIMGSLPQEVRLLGQKTGKAIMTAVQLRGEVNEKDIEKIHSDKIHYMKTIAHEADGLHILHSKDDKTLKMRTVLARDGMSSEIHHFPNKDFSKCNLGEDKIFLGIDENEAEEKDIL